MSLRRYATVSEISALTEIAEINTVRLERAEEGIDSVIAYFHRLAFAKAFMTIEQYDAANVTLTTTQATLANVANTSGYYQYTVLEILNGPNKGLRIAINDSTKSGANNILTFAETQTNTPGNYAVKIYQLGKFPMRRDVETETNQYYKTIPEFVKRCVAYQYEYLSKGGEKQAREHYVTVEVQVDRTDYTKRFDSSREKNPRDLVSPLALAILDELGLTTQSVF